MSSGRALNLFGRMYLVYLRKFELFLGPAAEEETCGGLGI